MISFFLASLFNAPVEAIKPPTRNEIQLTVDRYAFVYDVQPSVIFDVLKCESNFDVQARNDKEVHGSSHGIAQFRQETFDTYSKKAGIENGSPYNYDDAIKTLTYMISTDRGHHWTCYKKYALTTK